MKKLKYRLFVITLLFSILSCANLGDKNVSLGNGYVYQVDGDQRWIRADNIMKDGIYSNVLNYAVDSSFIIAFQQPIIKGYERLLAQDLRYRYETVLFNETSKSDPYYKRFINSGLWKDTNVNRKIRNIMLPDNQSSFEKFDLIEDSLIKFNYYYRNSFLRQYNYWIIQKINSIVYGPLSKQEYLNLRSHLGIDKNLKLH